MNFRYVYAIRLGYVFAIGFLLYMLFMARSGEVHTVWETLHPAFLPTFFAASVLLLFLVFSSSEKVTYKLLLIIMYSVLSHSFSAIVFPAGGIGPQQGEGLSITRLVFDSTIHDGLAPWPSNNILIVLFNWLRGENFQSVLSVIFARMLGVDVYWTHVWLSPVLWGVFIPLSVFAVSRTLGGSEEASVLACLLITAFPHIVLWGTFSVPNSLGYVFFFLSVLFFMKYLLSPKLKVLLLMATFFIASVLSHLLTGLLSISFLLLVLALKVYENERKEAPLMAKISLVSAFLLATILLPFALVFQRMIYPQYTNFSLAALAEEPLTRILGLFILGDYANFVVEVIPVFIVGPVLGLIGVVYMLKRSSRKVNNQHISLSLLLISLGYFLVLIDYRILKLFMTNVPFDAERLLVFEYLLVVSFVAFVINTVLTYLQERDPKRTSRKPRSSPPTAHFVQTRLRARPMVVYAAVTIVLAAWLTASVYYAYPHYSFLQITDYEIEAARYLETSTNKTYIVICDSWFAYAGGMLVGVNNTRAFYFDNAARGGVELFAALREDPSVGTMNKTLVQLESGGLRFEILYFVVEEPRLGADEFNRVVANATGNNLNVYHTFGNGRLYIFSYERK